MKRIIFILLCALCIAWDNTQWNSGVTVQNVNGGFVVIVPQCSNHLNSIQKNRNAVPINKTIVIRFKITKLSGTPTFKSLDTTQGLKPNFRPMIQVDNDYNNQDKRWWPAGTNCGFLAANMDGNVHELRITIAPNQWSNVYGKMANTRLAAFKTALNSSGHWQIVYGGGNSFSHGVCVKNGKVKFQILNFYIQ